MAGLHPGVPVPEEAMQGIVPPERTCSTCTCWRRHYEAWKHTVAPAWWPNAEPVTREELEAWVARQQGAVRRRARVEPSPR